MKLLTPPLSVGEWLSKARLRRGLAIAAVLVFVGVLVLGEPYVQTDPGELAAWMATLVWQMWTTYASVVNWSIWSALQLPEEKAIQSIALRRMRNSSFQAAIASIVFVGTTVTLFEGIGEVQSSLRTYSIVVVAILFSYRSVLDHMEQRSVDSRGIELELPLIPEKPDFNPKGLI